MSDIITQRRHPIRLTADAERRVRAGHPWVYDRSLERGPGADAQAGDLAVIFDRKRDRFLGIGFYDPDSPIRVKMLHVGGGVRITREWFLEKITAAKAIRAPLLQTDTNGYRLLFGENDGLPGLVADVYADCLVVKIYSTVWLPYLDWLVPLIESVAETQRTVLRFARRVQTHTELADGTVLRGELAEDEAVEFLEHGLRFLAYPVRGHKTGFFLDHRANRKRIGELASGKTVLDVFSYAGGFSVHALAGGARHVISLDISRPALAAAQANAALNPHTGTHEILAADAWAQLRAWTKQGRTFEVVIIDPPALAKRQSEVAGALRKYAELARLGAQLTARGGTLLLASCSSRVDAETFFQTNAENLPRDFRLVDQTFHDVDHPVGFAEGAYLKTGFYRRNG